MAIQQRESARLVAPAMAVEPSIPTEGVVALRGGSRDGAGIIAYFSKWVPVINDALVATLRGDAEAPAGLNEALAYLFSSGGKRFRPVLSLLASELVGGDPRQALDLACAMECFHTSSLILDDLPCMDDAQTRRGLPALHRRFGEASAILAALALFNSAHVLLLQGYQGDPARVARCHRMVASAIGVRGMIGGQFVDLAYSGPGVRLTPALEETRLRKTSALISAALVAGASRGGAGDQEIEGLRLFGLELGRLFQLRDDALDAAEDGARAATWSGELDLQRLRGRVASAISHLREVFPRRSEARDLLEAVAALAVDRRE
jgi:geranylgeranyl diphosphate synthase, type II